MAAYQEIAVALLADIESGVYEGRMPTIEELARKHSVAKATMQRAVGVLKDTKRVEAMPRFGLFATPQRRERTHVIGAVLGSRGGTPLHDNLISGMREAADPRGEWMAISPGHGADLEKELEQVKELVERRQVDGLVLWPCWGDDAGRSAPGVQYAKEAKIPFVIVPECDVLLHHDCNTVCTHDHDAARDAMMHLIGTGHKRIAFLTSRERQPRFYTRHRFDQYSDCMRLSELEPCEQIVLEEVTSGRIPLSRFSALFCGTDLCALGVMQYCLEQGIRVPSDLALVGYDNIPSSEVMGLTSVEQHYERIGTLAVELLLKDIEGELKSAQHLTVKSELVVRKSSGGKGESDQ